MTAPYNYLSGRNAGLDAAMGVLRGGAAIEQLANQRQARRDAQSMQEQYAMGVKDFLSAPSADKLNKMSLMFPERSKQFQDILSRMNEGEKNERLKQASRIHSALQAGNSDAAIDYLKQTADTYENSGRMDEAKHLRGMAERVRVSPESTLFETGGFLREALGAEKYLENYGQTEWAPSAFKQKVAEADKATQEASSLPDQLQTEQEQREANLAQTRAETEKLGADRAAVYAKIGFDAKKQKELPESSMTKVGKAVDKSIEARTLANRAGDLAKKYKNLLDKTSGLRGRALAKIRSTLGFSKLEDEIRTEYNSFKGRGITSNLPQGAASDTDIQLVASGFPDADAPAETLERFLEGMQKLEMFESSRQEALSEWVTKNKFEGAMSEDNTVMGIDVKKGTTLMQFLRDHDEDIYQISKGESINKPSYFDNYMTK